MVRLKLDTLLAEKHISRYELSKISGVQYLVVDNYYKNKVIRYDSLVLDRLCEALGCDIADLIERVKQGYKKQ